MGVPEAGCDLHCYTDGPEVMACRPWLLAAFGGAAAFSAPDDISRAAMTLCQRAQLLSETISPTWPNLCVEGVHTNGGTRQRLRWQTIPLRSILWESAGDGTCVA